MLSSKFLSSLFSFLSLFVFISLHFYISSSLSQFISLDLFTLLLCVVAVMLLCVCCCAFVMCVLVGWLVLWFGWLVLVCRCGCGGCGVVVVVVETCVVWHAENLRVSIQNVSVYAFKRSRVCRLHAHMCFNMWTWCRYTRWRFERTNGGVLHERTGREGEEEVVVSSDQAKICPRRVIMCFRDSSEVFTVSYPFQVWE